MPGPAPATARVRAAVRRALTELPSSEPTGSALVLAAVSGGTDSLALASALAFEAPRAATPVRAGAVIVDHGLQVGSDQVAARAAEECRRLGLDPVRVVPARVDERGDGPEAAARRARYVALDQARQDLGAETVLLGHTRADQAEQVLLGLLRGSGTRSLAGMPDRSGPYRRPLLQLPRSDTAAAVAQAGLTPWHDPHNDDPRFARTRAGEAVRELARLLGTDVEQNLARSADLVRADADALDALAAHALADLSDGPDTAEDASLPVGPLVPLAPAVRIRVLRDWLVGCGADASGLGSVHLIEVDRLVSDWHGQGPIDVPGRLRAVRRNGRLRVDAGHGVERGLPPPTP